MRSPVSQIKPDCDIQIVGISTSNKICPETPTQNKNIQPKRCRSNLFEVSKKSINFPALIDSRKCQTSSERKENLKNRSSLPTISLKKSQFLNEIEANPFETSILSIKNFKLN